MSGATPRVALVGPIPPWRSGIADQTARLARALEKLGEPPAVFTFRRMYPRWMFPGESDRGSEPLAVAAREVLDGFRPSSFAAAAAEIARLSPRLVILPWWTVFFTPHDIVFLNALSRLAPSAVKLLLCHNVVDHEANALKRSAALSVLRRADRLAVQNAGAARTLALELPGREVGVVPHPVEPLEVLPERDRARSRLGVPPGAVLFLFTGILRAYKGWDLLLQAFERAAARAPAAHLVFAGEPWTRVPELRRRELPPRVRAELRYLAPEERTQWLAACDAVVCPYRHASGSGVAADAIAHGRPVIGTSVDGLVDVIEDGVSGLLVPPGDVDALARALERFANERLGDRLAAGAVAARRRFTPESHARQLLALGGM